MTARMLGGGYIDPLFDLIETMIQRLDSPKVCPYCSHEVCDCKGGQGVKPAAGLALESGEFIPANELNGGTHGN
jgi:hypothetical protein